MRRSKEAETQETESRVRESPKVAKHFIAANRARRLGRAQKLDRIMSVVRAVRRRLGGGSRDKPKSAQERRDSFLAETRSSQGPLRGVTRRAARRSNPRAPNRNSATKPLQCGLSCRALARSVQRSIDVGLGRATEGPTYSRDRSYRSGRKFGIFAARANISSRAARTRRA